MFSILCKFKLYLNTVPPVPFAVSRHLYYDQSLFTFASLGLGKLSENINMLHLHN